MNRFYMKDKLFEYAFLWVKMGIIPVAEKLFRAYNIWENKLDYFEKP